MWVFRVKKFLHGIIEKKKKQKKTSFFKTVKGISEQGLVKYFNQNLKTNSNTNF